jgi:hypothetical protein
MDGRKTNYSGEGMAGGEGMPYIVGIVVIVIVVIVVLQFL